MFCSGNSAATSDATHNQKATPLGWNRLLIQCLDPASLPCSMNVGHAWTCYIITSYQKNLKYLIMFENHVKMLKVIDSVSAPHATSRKHQPLSSVCQPRYCQRSFRSCRLKHSSCYQFVEAFARRSDERLRRDKSHLLRVALAPHNLRGCRYDINIIQWLTLTWWKKQKWQSAPHPAPEPLHISNHHIQACGFWHLEVG